MKIEVFVLVCIKRFASVCVRVHVYTSHCGIDSSQFLAESSILIEWEIWALISFLFYFSFW